MYALTPTSSILNTARNVVKIVYVQPREVVIPALKDTLCSGAPVFNVHSLQGYMELVVDAVLVLLALYYHVLTAYPSPITIHSCLLAGVYSVLAASRWTPMDTASTVDQGTTLKITCAIPAMPVVVPVLIATTA